MKIIGLHGHARSGKDELTQILIQTYGFKHLSFAKKIKEFAIKYFELSFEEVFDTKTKKARFILQAIGKSVRDNINWVSGYMEITSPNDKIINKSGFPLWVERLAIKDFLITKDDLLAKRKNVKQILNGIHNMYSENIDEFIELSKGVSKDIWVNYCLQNIKNNNVYIVSDVRFKNEKNIIEKLNGRTVKIIRKDNPRIEFGENHISEKDLDSEKKWDFVVINEHRVDWKLRLAQAGANMIRKFKAENFFSTEDTEKFRIKLNEHK